MARGQNPAFLTDFRLRHALAAHSSKLMNVGVLYIDHALARAHQTIGAKSAFGTDPTLENALLFVASGLDGRFPRCYSTSTWRKKRLWIALATSCNGQLKGADQCPARPGSEEEVKKNTACSHSCCPADFRRAPPARKWAVILVIDYRQVWGRKEAHWSQQHGDAPKSTTAWFLLSSMGETRTLSRVICHANCEVEHADR